MEYLLKQIEPGNVQPIVIPLNQDEVVIGRKNNAALRSYRQVSREHAAIHKIQEMYYIRDKTQHNTLYVNGTRVGKDMRRLEVGDLIAFGIPFHQKESGGFMCIFTMRERIKGELKSDDDDDVVIIETVKEEIVEIPPVPWTKMDESPTQYPGTISTSLLHSSINKHSSQRTGMFLTDLNLSRASDQPIGDEKYDILTTKQSLPALQSKSIGENSTLLYQNRRNADEHDIPNSFCETTESSNVMNDCEIVEAKSEGGFNISDELKGINRGQGKMVEEMKGGKCCRVTDELRDRVIIEEKDQGDVAVKDGEKCFEEDEHNPEDGSISIESIDEDLIFASSSSLHSGIQTSCEDIESSENPDSGIQVSCKDMKSSMNSGSGIQISCKDTISSQNSGIDIQLSCKDIKSPQNSGSGLQISCKDIKSLKNNLVTRERKSELADEEKIPVLLNNMENMFLSPGSSFLADMAMTQKETLTASADYPALPCSSKQNQNNSSEQNCFKSQNPAGWPNNKKAELGCKNNKNDNSTKGFLNSKKNPSLLDSLDCSGRLDNPIKVDSLSCSGKLDNPTKVNSLSYSGKRDNPIKVDCLSCSRRSDNPTKVDSSSYSGRSDNPTRGFLNSKRGPSSLDSLSCSGKSDYPTKVDSLSCGGRWDNPRKVDKSSCSGRWDNPTKIGSLICNRRWDNPTKVDNFSCSGTTANKVSFAHSAATLTQNISTEYFCNDSNDRQIRLTNSSSILDNSSKEFITVKEEPIFYGLEDQKQLPGGRSVENRSGIEKSNVTTQADSYSIPCFSKLRGNRIPAYPGYTNFEEKFHSDHPWLSNSSDQKHSFSAETCPGSSLQPQKNKRTNLFKDNSSEKENVTILHSTNQHFLPVPNSNGRFSANSNISVTKFPNSTKDCIASFETNNHRSFLGMPYIAPASLNLSGWPLDTNNTIRTIIDKPCLIPRFSKLPECPLESDTKIGVLEESIPLPSFSKLPECPLESDTKIGILEESIPLPSFSKLPECPLEPSINTSFIDMPSSTPILPRPTELSLELGIEASFLDVQSSTSSLSHLPECLLKSNTKTSFSDAPSSAPSLSKRTECSLESNIKTSFLDVPSSTPSLSKLTELAMESNIKTSFQDVPSSTSSISNLPECLLESNIKTCFLDVSSSTPSISKVTECPLEPNNLQNCLETVDHESSENREHCLELNNCQTFSEKPFYDIPDLPDSYRFPFEKRFKDSYSENIPKMVTESNLDVDIYSENIPKMVRESNNDVDILEDCCVFLVRCDSEEFCLPPGVRWTNREIDTKFLRRGSTHLSKTGEHLKSFASKQFSLKLKKNRLSSSSDTSSDMDQRLFKKKTYDLVRGKRNRILSHSEESSSYDHSDQESGEHSDQESEEDSDQESKEHSDQESGEHSDQESEEDSDQESEERTSYEHFSKRKSQTKIEKLGLAKSKFRDHCEKDTTRHSVISSNFEDDLMGKSDSNAANVSFHQQCEKKGSEEKMPKNSNKVEKLDLAKRKCRGHCEKDTSRHSVISSKFKNDLVFKPDSNIANISSHQQRETNGPLGKMSGNSSNESNNNFCVIEERNSNRSKSLAPMTHHLNEQSIIKHRSYEPKKRINTLQTLTKSHSNVADFSSNQQCEAKGSVEKMSGCSSNKSNPSFCTIEERDSYQSKSSAPNSQQHLKEKSIIKHRSIDPKKRTNHLQTVIKSYSNVGNVPFHQKCETNGLVENMSGNSSNKSNHSFSTIEESDSNQSKSNEPKSQHHSNEHSTTKHRSYEAEERFNQLQTALRVKNIKTGSSKAKENKVMEENKSKKIRKAMLTDPKPMTKRPKLSRGREEWFEEKISEASSSSSLKDTKKPPGKQSHTPTTENKTVNSVPGADVGRSLKGFKIPKLNKDGAKRAESDQSSENKKKTTKVPRKSEKSSSRMGFLTDANVWKVKPVSRSNVTHTKQTRHPNSDEKKQTFMDRSKRGLEYVSNYFNEGKVGGEGGKSDTAKDSIRKKVRFNDAEGPSKKESVNRFGVISTYPKKNVAVIEPYVIQKENPQEDNECQTHLNQYFTIVKALVKWNPKWLEEQKDRSKPPPLVPDQSTAPLHFKNYESYFTRLESLVTLSVWDVVHDRYKHLLQSPSMSWGNFQCIIKSHTEQHGMMEIKCEAAVGEDVSYAPSYGDVILLNVENKKRTMEHFAFGFISFHKPVTFKEVSDTFDWKTLSQTWLDNAKFHLFSAYIKKRKEICTTSLLFANGFCNILPKLYVMEHISKLKCSPLIKYFMQPKKINLNTDFTLLRKDKKGFIQAVSTEITENSRPKIFLVQGSVATGKTHLISELIEKLLYESSSKVKVFVCTPSHSTADEICLRLVDVVERSSWRGKSVKLVRIGNANKINPNLLEYQLDILAEKCQRIRKSNESALDIRIKNLELLIAAELSNSSQHKLKDFTDQLTETKTQLRRMAESAKNWKSKVLDESDVIISTVTDFREYHASFPPNHVILSIACCIVDDACQCNEPDLVQCLTSAVRNLVLVGDTKQFVTGVSNKSLVSLSNRSLFDRFYTIYRTLPHSPMLILNEQHRMHSEIFRFPLYYFYKNKLKCSRVVDEQFHFFPLKPYVVLDIARDSGEDPRLKNKVMSEVAHDRGEDIRLKNKVMSDIARDCGEDTRLRHKVLSDIVHFLTETAQSASIGVITHETDVATQREALSRYNNVEVNSVEGFQSREKDVVIVSATNKLSDDFVTNEENLRVSLTRARKTLIMYGHISSLKGFKHWSSLLENALIRGVHVSVASLKDGEASKTFIEFLIKKM